MRCCEECLEYETCEDKKKCCDLCDFYNLKTKKCAAKKRKKKKEEDQILSRSKINLDEDDLEDLDDEEDPMSDDDPFQDEMMDTFFEM